MIDEVKLCLNCASRWVLRPEKIWVCYHCGAIYRLDFETGSIRALSAPGRGSPLVEVQDGWLPVGLRLGAWRG